MEVDEEELKAALMARIAERAELKANEKKYSSNNIKFISKDQRDNNTTTIDQSIIKKKTKQFTSSKKPIEVKKTITTQPNNRERNKPTNGARYGKRFKFEWDNSEDTLQGFFTDNNKSMEQESKKISEYDRLLKLADLRAANSTTTQKQQGEWSDPSVKALKEMTERDWRIVRENYDIRIRGTSTTPNPARNWDEMNLPEHLNKIIRQIGYTKPTPIQMQAIPCGLNSHDIVGIAETGSGKTCAFVLPLLVRLNQDPWLSLRKKCADDGPLALILGPTRELVNQIEEEVIKLGSLGENPVRTCAVVGGNSAEDQGFRLREGCDVVVATPGRLIDLLSSRIAVLNQCSYIVLDEADRMIDMGFEPQVNKVLESLVIPLHLRTTFMFSATMPPEVIRLSQRFLRSNRVIIRIGDEESGKNKNIEQHITICTNEQGKDKELYRILSVAEPPIIIFCNSKSNCDILVRELKNRGKRAVALHSGRNQEEREENLRKFKEGDHCDILVATDVAGRGLDVEGVSHVINYDCPTDLQRYTHRIGRTGRAGKSGKATTFIVKGGSDDLQVVDEISNYMRQTGQIVPPELISLLGDFDISGEAPIQE